MKKIIAKVLAAAAVVSAIAACPVMAGDVSTQTVVLPCLHENSKIVSEYTDTSTYVNTGVEGHGYTKTTTRYCVECDYVYETSEIVNITCHTCAVKSKEFMEDSSGKLRMRYYYVCTAIGCGFDYADFEYLP